jgi:hypothetical protein
MPRFILAPVATLVAAALIWLPAARVARAASVASDSLTPAASVQDAVDRAALARELEELGVDPAEAQRRIATLSDAELAVLQDRIDQLPAGGFVGAVVGAMLVVFLVLLVTDIAGLTDVFSFVKKHARR